MSYVCEECSLSFFSQDGWTPTTRSLTKSGMCGKTRISRLWIKAGVPQSKIYQVIQELVRKGLVEIVPKFPKEVKTVPFLRFANDFFTEKCLLDEIDRKIREHKGVLTKSDRLIQILGR